jgi:hypothetical protein
MRANAKQVRHPFCGLGAIAQDGPGMVVLDHDPCRHRWVKNHPQILVIIELLDEADVPRSKAFLDGKFVSNGLY